MKAYSQDLRERVVRACDEHRGTRQAIADLFGLSVGVWCREQVTMRRTVGVDFSIDGSLRANWNAMVARLARSTAGASG